MKVKVLIENTTDRAELVCEHGLSLLIEAANRKILLDAGSSEAFYDNAEAMGVNLNDIDACVLSHGHYDHSGGFARVFENNSDVMVYAAEGVLGDYYSGAGSMHDISVPENVRKHNKRFVCDSGVRELYKDIYLVPHSTEGLESIGARTELYKCTDEGILPDDFMHEQSLVYDTENGLIIFNSCSHGGVTNIVDEVKAACDNKPVYAYIGGLHMKGKEAGQEICIFSDSELDELCRYIQDMNIKYVYTGHCTGMPAMNKLTDRIGAECVKQLTTGLVFEL